MKSREHGNEFFQEGISRRGFLGASAGAIAAGAIASDLTGFRSLALAKETPGPAGGESQEVTSVCEMCVWRCGLHARVKDGVVVKLEGNPDHPNSRGKLCPKGNAGIMMTYDPDRLKTPLMRVGERGSGKFRKASWDEALDYVANSMKKIKEKYGPQAMVMSSTHNLAQLQFENLMQAYGTPNYGTQRSLCFNAMVMGFTMTYGTEAVGGDYEKTKYIIYNGRNLLEGIANSETQDLMHAVERGAHVVVLDPRYSKTATKAKDWLPVRPGGDLAFFLAVNNVLIQEKLCDKKFLDEYTTGFDELAEESKTYTPEWAEKECDIPAAKIREVARGFAKAAPAAFAHPNWRTSNTLNSFQTERAIAILNALVGNWKKPGGLFPAGGEGGGVELGSISQPPYPRVSAMRLDAVPMRYPLVPLKLGVFQELRDAIHRGKPYPAKGWLIFRQNPIMSLCDRTKTLEAIKNLDLIVSIDILPNDTAFYSDVILPESTYLERYDPLSVVGSKVFLRQPAVPPLYDTKAALEIFKLLGERLGLHEFFNYTNEEDYINAQLKPLHVTVSDLKKKGFYEAEAPSHKEEKGHEKDVFQTPSGKIEIVSKPLGQVGFPTIPKWKDVPRPEKDQFYLLSGKVAQHTQSTTQNNRWLAELVPENTLWIHTSAAQARGIQDGALVTVESKVGKMQLKAKVTEGIRPDCVWTNFGFGHRSKGLKAAYGIGSLDSDVHESVTDRVSGSQALSQTMVTVAKATA